MDSDLEQPMDIHKMKVPDLKRELKAKGLPTTGNKTELLERLQNALKSKMDDLTGDSTVDDLEEDLLNDDDDEHLDGSESGITDLDTIDMPDKGQKRKSEEMGDKPAKKVVLNRAPSHSENVLSPAPSQSDPAPAKEEEKKVVKLSELSVKERLELRAKKFGVTITGDAKKAARAERFGVTDSNKESQSSTQTSSNSKTPNLDLLKQRAERFGLPATAAVSNLDKEERLKRRLERFGTAPANGTPAQSDKLQQRLNRFKQTVK